MMIPCSANLGYLFTEYSLPGAIRESAKAGFKAVECHFPYQVPVEEVRRSLAETNLPMLGLNTVRGDVNRGDNGLAALPKRIREAKEVIDQAIAYGAMLGARHVHVMAGRTPVSEESEQCFVENLIYAGKAAGRKNMSILIEPMNPRDAPDYFLRTVEQASEIAGKTKLDNVKIMFDCYHVQINQGDVLKRFERHLPLIGHVQFASVPDRGEPDRGELDYAWLLPQFMKLGYTGFFGAEYRPRSRNAEHPTSEGLSWLKESS